MASSRRLKLAIVAALSFLLLTLYYTRDTRATRHSDLHAYNADRQHSKDTSNVQAHLREAERAAKVKANEKAPAPPAGAPVPAGKVEAVMGGGEPLAPEGTYEPMDEIDAILKRSPVIIFSKSYCGFSRAAKKLLLETYKIVPAPHVVELDLHPHGAELQAALKKTTGRGTVPNILIKGQSIGGSDDIAGLESQGKLASKITSLAGKSVISIDRQ